MNPGRFGISGAIAVLLMLLVSCGANESPTSGSQTNWLKLCQSSRECGDFECVCGSCTAACSGTVDCADLDGSSCVSPDDPGAIATCDGVSPPTSLCLPRCDGEECPAGLACIAGICQSSPVATARVSIDPTVQYQSLVGFGASMSHDEDFIVAYPQKRQLFDVMFAESGFDVIRLRNRYELGNTAPLAAAQEIVSAAAARLDETPMLFLSSGSPPAPLKANGTRACAPTDPGCTLARAVDGNFDYTGFADHWRATLEAYEARGIHPDLVSIQSNVDWLPIEDAVEACYFLPEQGTMTVTTEDGQAIEAEFPGYAEAMEAVVAGVSSLPKSYAFAGPEVGSLANLDSYAGALTNIDSVAYHLYGTDPDAVARGDDEPVSTLRDTAGKPAIQSAMQADGWATAILTHYALVIENSGGYLQQQFVAPTFDETSTALVGANGAGIEKLPAYHALWHFARFTDPGWLRIRAVANSPDILTSAWSSPDGGSLTVVVINRGPEPVDLELLLPDSVDGTDARVYRSVFGGLERSADLGQLSQERVLRLPEQAVVTVTMGGEAGGDP